MFAWLRRLRRRQEKPVVSDVPPTRRTGQTGDRIPEDDDGDSGTLMGTVLTVALDTALRRPERQRGR